MDVNGFEVSYDSIEQILNVSMLPTQYISFSLCMPQGTGVVVGVDASSVCDIQLLSVWGKEIFFCIFVFYVSIGVLLKGMIKSCLLSKDEALTPNIDKVMAV